MTEQQSSPRRLDEHERAAWAGFLRVHAAVTRRLDHDLRARHDLTLSDYEVLLLLATAPEGRLRASEVAERSLLTPAGITRLVDRLSRRGLLERRACPTDARGVLVEITDEGRALFKAAGRDHLRGVRALFLSALDADEQRLLAEVWERLLARLDARGQGGKSGRTPPAT